MLRYIQKEGFILYLNEHFKDNDVIDVTVFQSGWIPNDLKVTVKDLKENLIGDLPVFYNSKNDGLYAFVFDENGYTEYLIKDKRFEPLIKEIKKDLISDEI